jgi:hypothetical protein
MCDEIKLPDGKAVIVCGLRGSKPKFCACGREAKFLCDWKVRDSKSGTCDRPLCVQHGKQVAPLKHLCPEHQRRWEDWQHRHNIPVQPSLFQFQEAT